MKKILSILLMSILCLTFVGCQKSYDYEIEGLDINNISEDQQHDINLLGEILDKTYNPMVDELTELNNAKEEDRFELAYEMDDKFDDNINNLYDVTVLNKYDSSFKTENLKQEFLKYKFIVTGYSDIHNDYELKYMDNDYECYCEAQENADKIPHSLSEIDLDQLQAFYKLINDLRTDKE